MTNADKYFRYATAEEIAQFAVEKGFGCYTTPIEECYTFGVCKECWCDWLKQEIPAPPQKAPLCLSCKHGENGCVDDFATCYCPHHGYVGQKTKCGEYEAKEGKQ